MLVVGVDPGANFTGIAIYDTEKNRFTEWNESEDPVVIGATIVNAIRPYTDGVVVVEDYLGAGRRSTYSQRTTEVLGYIYHRCREEGITVERVPQQARLANVANVPKEISRKDEVSAAAHALSYRERNGLA
jgi:hypothetical protein